MNGIKNDSSTKKRKNLVDPLVSSCTESILQKNQLVVVQPLKNIQASKTLKIPRVNSDNVKVDFPNNRIIINIKDQEPAFNFLGLHETQTIRIQDMPMFPQNFAFGLFADFKAGTELSSVFPAIGDTDDDLALDFHLENEHLKLMMKFSTSRDSAVENMRRKAQQVRTKFEKVISVRVSKFIATTNANKRFCFSTMVCSKSSVLLGPVLSLDVNLVNEICARYRFALDVLTEIGLQGLDIEDDHVVELKGSILKVIKSIPEMYQDETATSRVKMTKKRVITDDITPAEAEEFVAERYLQCLDASVKHSAENDEANYRESIHKNILKRQQGTRTHIKHILQLPNCLPPLRTNWKWQKSVEVDAKSIFVNKIIDKTCHWNFFEENNLQKIKRKACFTTKDPEMRKSSMKHKIIYCPPPAEYRVDLAKDGVQGKFIPNTPALRQEVSEKEQGYSLDTYISDIDEFLFSQIPENRVMPCASVKQVTRLTLQALEMCDSRGSNTEMIIQPIINNCMFNWCSFVSAIASQLSVFLKEKVRENEWMVTRLREWDAYLIMKPRISHIYFLLVMPTKLTEVIAAKIARKAEIYSHYSIVKFTSYNDAKLVNLIKAESFFISMISQWSRHYGLTFLQGLDDLNVWAMTRLLILVHLEDKSGTDKIMSLFRYISMEKFSMFSNNSRKMRGKLIFDLRSRLQVWAHKKLVNAMNMPNYEAIDNGAGGVKWKNMMNPYTEKPVDSPAQLIELYYVGYATNKYAQSLPITEINLLKKVLEYEEKFHKVDEKWCGIEERDKLDMYEFHEWSRRANCAAADHLKKYLQRLYGDQVDNHLSEKIIHRLSKLTWDQVATLKSSSEFDPAVGRVPNAGGKFYTKRIKVIIAILKKKNLLAATPALSIASILSWIDDDGGLRVDICKKNQHGGLREIYILELRSRILQLILEEIARAICQDVPIEMMMHPESKMVMPQSHMYEAATKKAKYKQNICSSNDAKVWNQGHHVTKFAQFLIRVLPKDFHNLIVGGLKQFLFKRIALPDGVLNNTAPKRRLRDFNPICLMFWDAFDGAKPAPWLHEGETFLRIESGMMQGILHFTSSLFHASMLMLRNSLWCRITQSHSIDSITTDMVSSDDSSRLTDVFSDDLSNFASAVALTKLDHIAIKYFSPMYGIWISPKSTMCTSGVVEFNSEFYFGGNVFRPAIKWALAALGVCDVENLIERQETMNSQIMEMLEGGSGFRQASETQLAQLFLHYRLIGMETNPLFLDYANVLISNPDPALGFFLLDPPLAAGLAGFNFSLWKAISSHPTLNMSYARQARLRDVSTTTSGQLTRRLQIKSGNRKKVDDIIAAVENTLPNWHERIEANPSVLYGVSTDLESSLLKTMVKLTSPSVIKTLGREDSVFSATAAGSYLINGIVTTLRSIWSLTSGAKAKKGPITTSLWALAIAPVPHVKPLTLTELKEIFPLASQYAKLDKSIENLKKYRLINCGSERALKCRVPIFQDNPQQLVDLETVVRWKWFGEKLLASKLVADKLWIAYKKLYPWLKDSPFATLTNPRCQFSNQIELSNFVTEHSVKQRSVYLAGPPMRGVSAEDLVVRAIENNQMPGYTLEKPADSASDDGDTDSLLSVLASILTFPLHSEVKLEKISKKLIAHRDLWDGSAVKLPLRKFKVALIQSFLKLKHRTKGSRFASLASAPTRNLALRNVLQSSKVAVYGGFVPTEGTNGWNGDGEWVGTVGDTQCRLLIRNFTLISITTDDYFKFHENQLLLVSLLEEFHVTVGQSSITGNCFDLKHCQITHQGNVNQNTNLMQLYPLDLNQLRLRVTADTIRLLCRDKATGICYTVVAHTAEFADLKYPKSVDENVNIWNCWLNNQSLVSLRAEEYLLGLMDEEEHKHIHKQEFKQFVRDSLAPAIVRAGLDLHLDVDASPVCARPEFKSCIDENIVSRMILNLSKVNLTGANEGCFPELRPRSQVNYFDFCDYLEGKITMDHSESAPGAVKKIHSLWDEYAHKNVGKLSKIEKNMLQQRCYVPRISKFIRVIEYYFDLKFLSKRTENN